MTKHTLIPRPAYEPKSPKSPEPLHIKLCASRAAWLGNDHSHYIKKWADKDLENLKDLIHLTVNWIDSALTTEKIKKEMSKPK